MRKRDLLLMKLAALQVKHYGTYDPDFIKEAAAEVEALSEGGSVPEGSSLGAVSFEELPPEVQLKYWQDYYASMQNQDIYNPAHGTYNIPGAPQPAAAAGVNPYLLSAGAGAGGAASAAILAALLAKKRSKNKGKR